MATTTLGKSYPDLTSEDTGIDKVDDTMISKLGELASMSSYRYAGLGNSRASWQTFLSGFDRFGVNPVMPSNEVVGLTFITRPKLCLATSNLKQDRVMAMMNTMDPYRLEFSIRSYLDFKFAKNPKFKALTQYSPFINSESPFIVPLTNSLRSVGGHPDFYLDTETTQGGFYGEDQTIATGSDFNMRSYDFSLTFRDIQSGYVLSLFLFWVRYIALVRRGQMIAYLEDIWAQRLNYTCSIYRLVLDPAKRVVTKWSKATGCYPKSVPLGAIFDYGEGDSYVNSSKEITIPFQVSGAVEYMDPIILQEFNMLIQRWNGQDPSLTSGADDGTDITKPNAAGRVRAPVSPFANFCGIPYIDVTNGSNALNFWCLPEELEDPIENTLKQMMDSIESLKSAVVSGSSGAG